VIAVRQELEESSAKLIVELRNDEGQYASPGEGDLAVLLPGCQLDFSLGYGTESGEEVSSGQNFSLEACEHISSGGKANLLLHAFGGGKAVADWRARHQFRWNKSSAQTSVKELLALCWPGPGLRLEVRSQSEAISGFYPDFTIGPGDRGESVIRTLLSFVPDVLLIEGSTAYVINPQSSDSSAYSYGVEHPILEGRYRNGAWELNRVQVEGRDSGTGELIIVDSFAWDEIERMDDRLRQVVDRNIGTVAEAQERGEAYLRQAEMESASGSITVPVNCGQQPYDVVDITDGRAGLSGERKRVRGLVLVYNPGRGEYWQRLLLGPV